MNLAQARNKSITFYVIIFVFAIVYSLVSLVNHYNFRTYAWDLGINNNAIYDYAHFRWNDCMVMQPQFANVLSDHFSLFPILVSPLYWIFGSYTMLVFQIIAIIIGGIGIYKYFLHKTNNEKLSLFAMAHFYSVWGIYSALSFDYHDNVVGAMFVPWFFYMFNKRSWGKAFLFFLLLCISKENMALWGIAVALTVVLLHYKSAQHRKVGLLFSLFACVYFVAVVKLVIPAIANEGWEYLHFKYSALGENFSEAIKTILLRPVYVFKLIFFNQSGLVEADYIKLELHVFMLLSGGYALFFKPQYFLMLLPIYAQKLFNDDFVKWGLNDQYSIELVPILTLALYSFLHEWNINRKIIFYVIPCVVTIAATVYSFEDRVSKWYTPDRSVFYKKEHYTTLYDVAKVQDHLKLIPANANVSATNALVSHLAFRDTIYQFPVVKNAQYIVILKSGNTYPLTQEDFDELLIEIEQSGKWEKLIDQDLVIIFKRDN